MVQVQNAYMPHSPARVLFGEECCYTIAVPGEGDERKATFDAQVVPFLDDLYRAALHLCRNPADAEDLLQDTMVRAYRAWDRFVPVSNCKAWLFTILYNGFRNRLRTKRRTPIAVDIDDALEGPLAEQATASRLDDPAEVNIQDTFDDEIDAALRALPEEYLTVVMLVDLQDFTYEEAAEVLACPIGTVRSRLFRGRKLLHRKLFEYARSRGLVEVKGT